MASPPRRSRAGNSEYRLDDQVGFLLRVAMQRHTAIFMSRIIKGLTQTQFAAIAKLREVGPCSQNQLGRLIYLDAATTKGVVDRLEARGFVTASGRKRPPPPRHRAHRQGPRRRRCGGEGGTAYHPPDAGAAHGGGAALSDPAVAQADVSGG